MYNQVICNDYTGDGKDADLISKSILDVCTDHDRTTKILNDLIFLSQFLYHTSMAESKKLGVLMEDCSNNDSNSDSGSDSDSNGNGDGDGNSSSVHSIRTIKLREE